MVASMGTPLGRVIRRSYVAPSSDQKVTARLPWISCPPAGKNAAAPDANWWLKLKVDKELS